MSEKKIKLRLDSLQELVTIWQTNFLGAKGLLLPNNLNARLGQRFDLLIELQGKNIGKIKAIQIWQNIHGPFREELPQGIFLKALHIEGKIENLLPK